MYKNNYLIQYLLTRMHVSACPFQMGTVKYIDVELTNNCNLKCAFCPTGMETNTRPIGFMEFDIFKKIIDGLNNKTNIQLAGYGEPLLHPKLFDYIEYANNKKIDNIFLFTNLLPISEENVNRLKNVKIEKIYISLDTLSPQYYKKYKGRDLYEKAIEKLYLLKNKIGNNDYIFDKIIVQMVVTKQNYQEIDKFRNFVTSIGFTPAFKTLNIELCVSSAEKILQYIEKEYNRYEDKGYKKRCYWLWGGAIVYWNGDVSICCNDPNGLYNLGNIKSKKNLSKYLWSSSRRNDFRKIYFNNPGDIPICKMCRFA